jgi:DNA-binding NarL/FixJ family response regulator
MSARPAPHVLLLDDHVLVRAGLRALIEICEPDARVDEATSSREALAHLREKAADVAFLDIALKEDVTGVDVLVEIRTLGLPTRVVMLSANADRAMVGDCLRLGANGYIPKDTTDEGLFRRALDTVLSGGVFLPASLGQPVVQATPISAGTSESGSELAALGVRGRAIEALYYLCQGYSNQLIAHRMGVAEATIANDYNTRMFRLFGVSNRAALIVEVARRGLTLPPPPATATPHGAGRPHR